MNYHIIIFWSDDDGGWIAVAPDLPGCSAFGETRGDAAAQVEDAIAGWLEACKRAGNRIPEASRFDFSDRGPVKP